jgi:pimeloyl-ACP methyl ester carboxylesterase
LVRAGFRVVGVDLPAHGGSQGRTTNIIESGDAITEVAGQLGGLHAIVAHSLGAHTALYAMKKNGLHVERAVFIAPNVDFLPAFETFQEIFSLPPKAIVGLKRKIERRFGSGLWLDMKGDVLAAGMEVPGLVFHDPNDPVVPFNGSKELVRAWRAAHLVPVENVGHGHITRDPRVISLTIGFVSMYRAEEVLLDRAVREPATL